MTGVPDYYVILYKSVSQALLSEKLLKSAGIPFKLIPVPKNISSDCGVCIRFLQEDRARIEEALSAKVEMEKIWPLL
ncbi:MAG: DUF3343 domain-containing protein [Spirochaetes bacterium]|jgi:hypothetical protein|nr:DUF3343 domain-containing protein [Spirochaetota bacterium]